MLDELREEYEARIASLRKDYEERLAKLKEDLEGEMRHRDLICNRRISDLEERLRRLGARVDDISG
jgi:hypothetical protein